MADSRGANKPVDAAASKSDSDGTFAGRLTQSSKWAIGLLGAAGSFGVANFAFSTFGDRPVKFDEELQPFDWPGGEAWSFIGAILFGLGLVLAVASVLAIRRVDRVSMAYLTGRAYWFTTRRAVKKAIERSKHLTQVPLAGHDLIAEAATSLSALFVRARQPLCNSIQIAAQQASTAWVSSLATTPDEIDKSVWNGIERIHGKEQRTRLSAAWEADPGAAIVRIRSALRAEGIEDRLLAVIGPALVDGMSDGLRDQLSQMGIGDAAVDLFAEQLDSTKAQVKAIVDRLNSALSVDDSENGVAMVVQNAARRNFDLREPGVGLALIGELELEGALHPNLIELDDLQVHYARAIRRGDRVQAAHFLNVVRTVLQTARLERVQVIAARNAVALPLAAVLIPLGASLFIFHVNAASQMREDQKTAIADRRVDELRAAEESVEGNVIASAPSIAALRLPADLPAADPWASALDEKCRLVDIGTDQLQPRSIPVVVLELGAPPIDDPAVLIAGHVGPDPGAVVRVTTTRTGDCPRAAEGWAMPAWVVSPDLPQAEAGEPAEATPTTTAATTPPTSTG